jgi:cystathionine beta-lyase/cystathionine gamma-synthase|tara:strand:- start:2271 stop:3554 length:1284 start_codon:yes stop_codon:yes gene_type:complete
LVKTVIFSTTLIETRRLVDLSEPLPTYMASDETDKKFATKAVHSGTNPIGGGVNTPVFLSSTYHLTEERYAGWAAGAQHTMLYARLSSINSEAVAAKLVAMEGAEDGETFASGMAAISTTLLGLLSSGDHVIASADVYGGTYGLMTEDLPRFGIEVTMADMRDPSSYEAAIQENTKMIYVETISNPVLKVCDLDAMSEIAKRHGLISVVDNTFASPWGCNPVKHGFDLVIHSGTKYLGGHSDLIAGFVAGKKDLVAKLFPKKVHFGGAADPHMCYLLERGMRTLHARMPIHTSNAAELAKRLSNHPMIDSVNHISLPDYDDFELAQRIIPKGSGMLAFVVKGGDTAALKFIKSLKMTLEATSLGGVESLVECPFNSSHMFVPEEVRMEAGVIPGFVRMSVGIEDVEDIWKDIEQGLLLSSQLLESRA